MTIAVVGATGNTGRAVVKELQTLGQKPISVVRNADKAREVLGTDAKVAVAELTDKPAKNHDDRAHPLLFRQEP